MTWKKRGVIAGEKGVHAAGGRAYFHWANLGDGGGENGT